jgi:hypothetical protein
VSNRNHEKSRSWRDYPWLNAALAIMVGVSYCMGRLGVRSEHNAGLASQHSTLSGVSALILLVSGNLDVGGRAVEGATGKETALAPDAPLMEVSEQDVVIDFNPVSSEECRSHQHAVRLPKDAGVRTRVISADGDRAVGPENVISIMSADTECRTATRIQTFIPRQKSGANDDAGNGWPSLPADWAPGRPDAN